MSFSRARSLTFTPFPPPKIRGSHGSEDVDVSFLFCVPYGLVDINTLEKHAISNQKTSISIFPS
jgi:hypothetical protein